MGEVRPELPIRHKYRTSTGPIWSRKFIWQVDEYDNWEDFFHDVEILDTFGDENQWIEDSEGRKWDVRTSEYLMGDPDSTVFKVREP